MIDLRRLFRIPLFRKRDSQRGNSLLEFAVGSGVLLAAFTGTYQFGYGFYRYTTLCAAVTNAAYYASQRKYDSATNSPSTAFSTAVKNMAVYGNPSGGSSPIAPGLTTANINIGVVFSNNVPGTVTVSVTGYTLDAITSSFSLNGKPRATFPYNGIWSPY